MASSTIVQGFLDANSKLDPRNTEFSDVMHAF